MTRPTNRLGRQTSPYLLQHRHNPVDWYPWGAEALERARREDRPIFLSIGYAACHWCHVMERESFENEEIAELLNRNFVPVKVDREERPDLDEIYMNAVQLLTGTGGWPLNIFLTPDLRPFTGGTYFPPEARHGLIGFPELLRRIATAWSADRERIVRAAGQLTGRLREMAQGLVAEEVPVGRWDPTAQEARAAFELSQRFDARWGGFGGAPKFPPDGGLALLLREHARSGEATSLRMAQVTLDRMALGGMYDHLGGGFARYSVDERWLVPHFEKMLYNQALLVPLYVDAFKLTRRPLYRRVVEQTLDFVRRELSHADGGFFSSLDADSEGQEGRFYVWSAEEILEVLGPEEGRWFNTVYGVTSAGNFEGRNILNLLDGSLEEQAARQGADEAALEARLAPLRERLLQRRGARPRPATDDKILTAWNGLALTAFARAYQAFGREADLRSAERCARFVLRHLRRDGRLLVSFREGQAQLNAYLDDHAFFGRGLLDLYEAGFETAFLDAAAELAQTMVERFEDREHGGFFFTSDDHEALLLRNRSLHDGALPAGAGVAAELLLRLSRHLDREGFRRSAERALLGARPVVERMPSGFAAVLHAAGWAAGPVVEVSVLGPSGDGGFADLLAAARRPYVARMALAASSGTRPDDRLALLAGKSGGADRAMAYVCRDFTCGPPTSDPAALERAVETAARP